MSILLMGTETNAGIGALSLFKFISVISAVALFQIIEWFGVLLFIIVHLNDGQFGSINGAI